MHRGANRKISGLSRKERLRASGQFLPVYRRGRRFRGKFIWIYCLPNGLEFNRLGISAANRDCRHIVQRNRIKRIMREVYRHNKTAFNAGMDIVLALKVLPEHVDYQTIEKDVISALKC